MLREFVFTIITRGDLSDADNAKVLERYEELMTADGGEILKKDEWGNKRLAYPIKKAFRGHYTNYDYVGTTENLAEMQRLIRIDDKILRHLVVRLDKNNNTGEVDTEARKVAIAKAAQARKEAASASRERT